MGRVKGTQPTDPFIIIIKIIIIIGPVSSVTFWRGLLLPLRE